MTGSACHILPHQLGFGPPKPSRGKDDDCDKYEVNGTGRGTAVSGVARGARM